MGFLAPLELKKAQRRDFFPSQCFIGYIKLDFMKKLGGQNFTGQKVPLSPSLSVKLLALSQASFLESLIKDDINILVTKIWCIFSILTQFALVSWIHLDFENKHWNLNWLSFYKISRQNMLKTAKMEKRILTPYLVTE